MILAGAVTGTLHWAGVAASLNKEKEVDRQVSGLDNGLLE
jgi:hypothetical protein